MKKIFLYLVVLGILLAGCGTGEEHTFSTSGKETTLNIPSTTQPHQTPENTGGASEEWVEVETHVFDITSQIVRPSEYELVDVSLSQRLLFWNNIMTGVVLAQPFLLPGEAGQPGPQLQAESSFLTQIYADETVVAVIEEDYFSHTTTLKILNRQQNIPAESWVLPARTVLGTGEEGLLGITTENGLQRFWRLNLLEQTTSELFQQDMGDLTQIPAILSAAEGASGIAFTGLIAPSAGETTLQCYGLMDKSGNVVQLHIMPELEAAPYQGGLVLYDSMQAFGGQADKFHCLKICDADQMTIRDLQLESPENETFFHVTVSETGKFILTRDKSGEKLVYRVYDTVENRMIAKYEDCSRVGDCTRVLVSISEADRAFGVLSAGNDSLEWLYYTF